MENNDNIQKKWDISITNINNEEKYNVEFKVDNGNKKKFVIDLTNNNTTTPPSTQQESSIVPYDASSTESPVGGSKRKYAKKLTKRLRRALKKSLKRRK
jgi:hypothetical protein